MIGFTAYMGPQQRRGRRHRGHRPREAAAPFGRAPAHAVVPARGTDLTSGLPDSMPNRHEGGSMATRNGSAEWQGDLRSGSGDLTVGESAWRGEYSFASRFEEGAGTNPEELLA